VWIGYNEITTFHNPNPYGSYSKIQRKVISHSKNALDEVQKLLRRHVYIRISYSTGAINYHHATTNLVPGVICAIIFCHCYSFSLLVEYNCDLSISSK
jgi:hypothetical protein